MVLPGLKPSYLLPGGGGVGLSVDGAVCAFLFYFIAAASCAPSASPPFGKEESSQKLWDSPQVSCVLDSLIASASDDSTMARLLAVLSQGSGAWLNAVPITTLGLRLNDNAVRIAAATHLGLPVCSPHLSRNCSASVDQFGLHGLHCKKSGSHFLRHASLNDVLKRSFSAAGIPSSLEPSGLSRSDGKHPDGFTLIPWKQGRPLVWNVTVPDTLAPSYWSIAVSEAGAVAAVSESQKSTKYGCLPHSYLFPGSS